MTTFTYDGQTVDMILHADDHISNVIAKGGFYEPEMLRFIAGLQPHGTIIDVGANIGNHAVFFGLFTTAKHVIAIEPYRPNFNVLVDNITANHLRHRVYALRYAAGRVPGTTSMQNHDPHNMGDTSMVAGGGDTEVRRLDDIVQYLPCAPVSVIKIDVQGAECDVLWGAQHILRTHQPHLFIEAETADAKRHLDDLLTPFGYVSGRMFNWTPTYHYHV